MKHTILAVAILFSLAGPTSVLAEEQAVSEATTETVPSVTEASTTVNPDTPRPMHGKGMMHKGKGQHGKGHGGMKHGGGHQDKGHHEKHAQVVRRLDMIEVRLAKIEAMLEILMRR
ncbi:MAG: hypothetical protein WBN43_01450 [Thiogranum sp.]